jgi:multidrug efflux pump subunit AcrB
MQDKTNWFGRPVAALCLLGGILLLSLFALMNREDGESRMMLSDYSITFRHYGVDAREIERTIAIPLEDVLSSISGVNSVITLSENSRLRAYVSFRREGVSYEAVREAAQRVYETLPASAQRPELGSSDDSRIPVWTAAVWETSSLTGRFLEKTVKPALERLPGAAEVEISGSGINEIVIALDPEKSASLSLTPRYIASVMGRNDGLFSGGVFRDGEREILLNMDSRYNNLQSLSGALIPLSAGKAVRLGDMASVYEQERESESIARLDGKKTAVISVIAASGADLGKLSRLIKEELGRFSSSALEFRILRDRGEEEAAAFRSVLTASLQAAVIVAISAALLMGRKNKSFMPALICAFSVPLVSFVSASLLSAFGFPLDRKLLAGLSVGIGAAADAVILGAESFGALSDPGQGGRTLVRLLPPVVSGAFTTVAALLPLAALNLSGDIASVAWALGTVTLVSMIFALTVLPPLFIVRLKRRDFRLHISSLFRYSVISELFLCSNALTRISLFPIVRCRLSRMIAFLRKKIAGIKRRGLKIFARHVRFCLKRPWCFPFLSVLISAAGCLALFAAGADIGSTGSENSVYARLEFEGGFRKEEGDTLLSAWAADIKEHNGILSVQTSARTGSGAVLVTFDQRLLKEQDVRKIIRSRNIPGAFIYIPENSTDERSWEITFSGADDKACRDLAEKAAALCASFPLVRETVLNFKEGNPRLSFIPRRDLFSQGGILFSAAADTIRRGVYGPVAYKRNTPEGEMDVRVRLSASPLSGNTEAGKIFFLPLSSGDPAKESLRIGSLTETFRDHEPSLIRREDRRRTASLSVRTSPMDPRKAREKIFGLLQNMELPPGYTIEFDRKAIREAETLSKTSFRFLLALIFCYMIIAASGESFGLPLVILSSVPPSLAVPVLVLTLLGFPINAAAACSLVAVSGMAVNASVLIGENFKQFLKSGKPPETMKVYRLLRSRFPVLAACTGTTAAGALPFLLLRENSNAMLKVLSLVTFLGVTASAFCAMALIPSWVQLVKKSAMDKKGVMDKKV